MLRQKPVSPFLALTAILIFTFSTGTRAGQITSGALSVQEAWARPSIGNAPNGVAYLKITNAGEKADRLVGASANVAKRVGLHVTTMKGGIMKMRAVMDGIAVPAKGKVELKPGGFHLMLMGLTRKLSPGESFEMTLTFERQGNVRVSVEIKTLGYNGASKAS